jgi:hypothetical protein
VRASPRGCACGGGTRRPARDEPAALEPTPTPDDDDADGGNPAEADDDGDELADLLAEAEARAKLARAPDVADAGPPRRPEPAPAAPRLGSATRMRKIGEQIVALCASGRAAAVQPLAEELLLEKPPPWLERRIRKACFGDTSPSPSPPPPPPPNDEAEE